MVNLPTLFVMINLFAVLALTVTPFIFFNVFAEESSNVWQVTIPRGASVLHSEKGFVPLELPVSVGDTIVWKNEDSVIHIVTSGIPKSPEHSGIFFNLGKIYPGESGSYTLGDSEYNGYYYFCSIHPWLTGKIFVDDLEIAKPETENPILLNKKIYSTDDIIEISGAVHIDFAGTDYTVLIYNENNKLVDISFGKFDRNSNYVHEILVDSKWKQNGSYQVKVVYAVPSKVAESSFEISNSISQSLGNPVPIWIKNIGAFWCTNQIDDSEFINSIQYLINEEIIHLEKNTSRNSNAEIIPSWVKNNACWWSDNIIPDVDFISGIEYLVNIGTIKI